MKIAINCAFFKPKGGGIKEYIYNLIQNLEKVDKENEYVVYVLDKYVDYARHNLNTNFRIKPIPFKGDSIVDNIVRSLFESSFWRKEEKTEKWDLFHSPFFHAPVLKNSKLLLTVHDLRFKRFPETYEYLRSKFLEYTVKKSILRCDHIISISNFTKSEIIDAYKITPDKITVIHEAINKSNFIPGQLKEEDRKKVDNFLDNPFILSVGHIEPRKNYDRLIEGYKIVKKDLSNYKLVIVGKKGNDYKSTLKLMDATPGVVYLDYVSDNLLAWLYANAKLFVFPSIYEGFGFPPLEAAANGLISAVSNASCIPEICGEYVDYFDPYNINDIATSIQRCLTDNELREKKQEGLEKWLSLYSWRNNAKQTYNIYNKMVK